MKIVKKTCAVLLSMVIFISSAMTGGILSSAAETLPETNVNLTATGGWPSFKVAVHDHCYESKNVECVEAATGIVSKNYPDAYVVYKVAKNSPFIAEFKIFRTLTQGSPIFYVSPDGVNYTEYQMALIINGDFFTYYTNGIGINNKYVKIVICDTAADYWHCDLRSLSYNEYVESDEPEIEEDAMPVDIDKSPNLDYRGKTVGVLTPNKKPAYYNDLLTILETEINADITEISWTDVSTALDPTKIEVVIIPDSSTVPYGTKTAVNNYLNNGGKLLSLGGVPFENTLYSYNDQWIDEYEYMKESSNSANKKIIGEFNSTLLGLSGWGRNQSSDEGNRTTNIGDYDCPTNTNALYVKLENLQSWDMLRRDISGKGYKSVGFWAKGAGNTKEIAIEVRESDNARWYASVPITEEWEYYVLGVNDFTYWQWDSNSERGGAGDKLNFENSDKFFIGLSGSFSSVATGEHEYWLDDVCFLNYEKPVEDEYVLEGLSPSWKYYPITNGNSVTVSDNQVFVADRKYVLPDDAVSINSGTQGIGFASGKMTRFVPLIEIYDSKELLSGYLAWMNINSTYSANRKSNGSITACFGTDDPDFYNTDGLAAVLDTVRTMLNDTLFTEAGTTEYIYVESETDSLKMGGYVRGESMSGVTMDIDLASKGKRIAAVSYEMESALTVRQYADTVLNTISVDYQLSEGKPDTVMITLTYPSKLKKAYYAVKNSLRSQMPTARISKFDWKSGEIFRAEIWYMNDSAYITNDEVIVSIIIGDEEYKLFDWKTGDVQPLSNKIGPSVNFELPHIKGTNGVILKLKSKNPDKCNEYELLYKCTQEPIRTMQLNV